MGFYVVHPGTGTILDMDDELYVVATNQLPYDDEGCWNEDDEGRIVELAVSKGLALADLIPSAALSMMSWELNLGGEE